LAEQVESKQPDELVRVWIKLPPVESYSQFKAAVKAQATTRAERHQTAIQRLRMNHSQSQQELLRELKKLEQDNLAANVKAHWLVNIVEADIAVGHLTQLAGRNDIEAIYPVPKIKTAEPTTAGEAKGMPALAAGVSNNLQFIKADSAWKAGYTGAGRIICSFDTGIDGLHPALFNNWKGHDGDSAAAWFDPKDRASFPHTLPGPSTNHGTQTMGLMVGHDDATGDTIGVAPAAKWISAAVIDISGASIIDAFEWAADPDGDPNSIDDVPDVINHSWGVEEIGCMNIFYDLIDNTEALGIVNIFAAGNEGPTVSSIRNPANRANDSLDCFAVGNFDIGSDAIASSSSRGPSDCNGAVKPNVCAPGTSTWTSTPNGGYGPFGGTSAAAPHVSGLVALLRQKNPNATVDELKEAILAGAVDYGTPGPDNDYGWGVIDCMAALNALPSNNPTPNIRVYAFDHPPIAPGDTVVGTLVLQNIGADAFDVSATLTGTHPALTILNGSAYFGTIFSGDTVRSPDSLRVVVSDTVTIGSILTLDLNIIDSGGNLYASQLHFQIEPPIRRLFVTHNANRISFSISNFGTYGLGPDDNSAFFPIGGVGFTFDGGVNDLYEAGLLIGTDANHVSDGVRNPIGEPDGDFAVLPGGNIELIQPGTVATQETFSRFSDNRAENPIGLEITQESFASDLPQNNDFIILRYVLSLVPQVSSVSNFYVGIYFDWDVVNYASNAGGWDAANEFIWVAYNNGSTLSGFRGVKVLDGATASAFTTTSSYICYSPCGDGFTELEKYTALTAGFSTSDAYKTAQQDLNQVISAGPLSLNGGQKDTVAFAILAGNSLAEITDAASRAVAFYGQLTSTPGEPGGLLPSTFSLSQNYPNPFNPRTTIEYSLSERSRVTLTVYNILGQEIQTLVDKEQNAGRYSVVWDGKDEQGKSMASGVYLYRLSTGKLSMSRKMLLLK
jgi:subtilisin family serine protease